MILGVMALTQTIDVMEWNGMNDYGLVVVSWLMGKNKNA
jgi:hypothetical protein